MRKGDGTGDSGWTVRFFTYIGFRGELSVGRIGRRETGRSDVVEVLIILGFSNTDIFKSCLCELTRESV